MAKMAKKGKKGTGFTEKVKPIKKPVVPGFKKKFVNGGSGILYRSVETGRD